MKYKDIIDGLKSGEIKILGNHTTQPLISKLEEQYSDYLKIKSDTSISKKLKNLYDTRFDTNIKSGTKINVDVEQYCFDCDETMFIFLLNDKTIGYVPYSQYSNIINNYEYKFKPEDIKSCSCCKLREEGKLTSRIEVPTGKLIFQNIFKTTELYEDEKNRFNKPTINSLLGRDKLMQYLATKNVGYGQMGNMSVDIYSNNKDEILVIDNYFENFLEEKEYYEVDDSDQTYEDIIKFKEENLESYQALDYIQKGGFEKCGSISLSVWRWMCADKEILDTALRRNFVPNHQEEINDDAVIVDVEKGTYQIEHYYDFSDSIIASKIKKI